MRQSYLISLLALALAFASCSSVNMPNQPWREISSVKPGEKRCYQVGNWIHNAEVCEKDKVIEETLDGGSNSTNALLLFEAIYPDKLFIGPVFQTQYGHVAHRFYLTNPGLCSYNKKFCIGDKLSDGSEVAAIYYTSNPQSNDVSNDTVLLKKPDQNSYRRHRGDMDDIKKFYEGQIGQFCISDTVYEGTLTEFKDNHNAKYDKLIASDKTGKCTLKFNKSKYRTEPQLHAMSFENFQKHADKYAVPYRQGDGYFYIVSGVQIPKNGLFLDGQYKDGEMQEFSAHLKYYIATSMLRIVPLSLGQETKMTCKNLIKHELPERCHEAYNGQSYPGYDYSSSSDKNSYQKSWDFRFNWMSVRSN